MKLSVFYVELAVRVGQQESNEAHYLVAKDAETAYLNLARRLIGDEDKFMAFKAEYERGEDPDLWDRYDQTLYSTEQIAELGEVELPEGRYREDAILQALNFVPTTLSDIIHKFPTMADTNLPSDVVDLILKYRPELNFATVGGTN